MDSSEKKNDRANREHALLTNISQVILAVVALGFVLYFAQSVLIPFVLAIFVVSIVSPILDFQVLRFRFPRALAVTFTLVVVLCFISVLVFLIYLAIQTIIARAATYSDSFIGIIEGTFDKLHEWGVAVQADSLINDLRNQIPKIFTNTFGTVMSFFSSILFMTIFIIFLLAGRNPHTIRRGMYADVDTDVRRYIATKLAVSAATGMLVWISLSVLGLELANVFGILAFLLNFIPSIGSIVATLLPIPIAVAQFDGLTQILLVILIPGVIQMTIGNVIEPRIMGTGLKLHPVVILLALSFWGLLWGIPGMFLAVPITAVIRIVLMQFDTLRPIAMILSGYLPDSVSFTEEQAETQKTEESS